MPFPRKVSINSYLFPINILKHAKWIVKRTLPLFYWFEFWKLVYMKFEAFVTVHIRVLIISLKLFKWLEKPTYLAFDSLEIDQERQKLEKVIWTFLTEDINLAFISIILNAKLPQKCFRRNILRKYRLLFNSVNCLGSKILCRVHFLQNGYVP